jgi:hypothetical protein
MDTAFSLTHCGKCETVKGFTNLLLSYLLLCGVALLAALSAAS